MNAKLLSLIAGCAIGVSALPLHADPLKAGSPLPAEFKVEGWLQGDAVKPADLKGKVTVIEAWAFW